MAGSDDEILIRIAADVAAAVAGLNTVVTQMGTMAESITAVDEAAKASAGVSEGFAESWTSGVDQSGAATVAMGTVMADTFEQIGQVVGTVVAAFPAMISAAAAAGDEAFTMSQRLGVSVEKLDEFSYIAEQSGTSMEGLARTTQQLGSVLADSGSKSAKAIEALGLSIEDLQQMSPDEAFFDIIQTLQTKFPDATERSTAAMEIFGNRFGQNTAILGEDIGELRASFDKLGPKMSTEFAKNADAYGAAWTNIQHVQDQFRNQVANAVLPTLTSLLEQFPALGGAAVTLGGSLFAMSGQLVPLISNIGLLASSGLGGWLKTTAMALPGVTTLVNGLSFSVKGLTASLGPLAVAVAGVAAVWATWELANKESGFFRDRADDIEWAMLRLQGYTDAQAEAMIADQHRWQKQQELAAAQEALGTTLDTTTAKTRTQVDGFAALTAEMQQHKDGLAALTTAQRSQIASALAQGQSLQHISDLTKVSTGTLELFQKQLDATKKAADASPLTKFREEMQKLHTQLSLAAAAGAPASAMLEQFGKDAQKARTAALLIPGGLREITTEILALADAADLKDLNAMLEDFHTTTIKVATAWQKDMKAAAQAWADFTTKQLGEAIRNISAIETTLTRNQQVGLEKRLAQLEDAEAKEIDIVMRRLGVSEEIRVRELNATREKYDELRMLERAYYGNVERDMELRGQKTLSELQHVADAERAHFTDMLAVWKEGHANFTAAQLQQQKERAENAEREAGHFVKTWKGALGTTSNLLGQLGDSFTRIGEAANNAKLQNIGKTLDFSSVMADGVKGLLQAEGVIGKIQAAAQLAADAIAAMWDMFTRSPGEDVMRRVGHRLGVAIGEELGDTIAATAKETFDGDRFAAEVFHLADIIEAAGGITEQNFDKLLGGLRDTFVMLEQKMFTVEQARETLDKNFGAFADHVVQSGKVASAAFVEMIRLNTELGVNSKEVADFVRTQVGSLGASFEKLVSPQLVASEDSKKVIKELRDEWTETDKAIGKLKLENKGGAEGLKDLSKLSKDQRAELAELEIVWARQKTTLDAATASQAKMAAQAMPALDRAGRLMTASFNAALSSGVGFTEAIDQLGPGLDSVLKTMANLGIEVEDSSVAWVVGFRNRVNANRALVDSAASVNDIMLAMSNIGALNEDTFADLQAQGTDSYDKLRAAGFESNEALTMMKGFLESARNAHVEMGLPIDENTASLIAQAEQAGIIKEQQLDTNQIMMDGLGAIIEAVGGKLPEAWKKAEGAAVTSAKTVANTFDATVNAAIGDQEQALKHNQWQAYATDADRAARKAKDSLGKVDGSIADVDAALNDTDWDGWAREGVDAAREVEGAVTGVAEGHSPGGIKDIPIRLAQAERAFRIWERTGVTSASTVQSAIDAMRGRELGVTGIRTDLSARGIPEQDESGDFLRRHLPPPVADEPSREHITMNFSINSLDPAGVELTVERSVIPAIVKVLRRGRHLADMQQAMNMQTKGSR